MQTRGAFGLPCTRGTQQAGSLYFLGDYVGYGYVARGAAAILGNHDAAVLSPGERMNDVAQVAIDGRGVG
jgi:hypothetical protein